MMKRINFRTRCLGLLVALGLAATASTASGQQAQNTYGFAMKVEALSVDPNGPSTVLYEGEVKKDGNRFFSRLHDTEQFNNARNWIIVNHREQRIYLRPALDLLAISEAQILSPPDSSSWSAAQGNRQPTAGGGYSYSVDRPTSQYDRITTYCNAAGFITKVVYTLHPQKGNVYSQMIAHYDYAGPEPAYTTEDFSASAFVRKGKLTRAYQHYELVDQTR